MQRLNRSRGSGNNRIKFRLLTSTGKACKRCRREIKSWVQAFSRRCPRLFKQRNRACLRASTSQDEECSAIFPDPVFIRLADSSDMLGMGKGGFSLAEETRTQASSRKEPTQLPSTQKGAVDRELRTEVRRCGRIDPRAFRIKSRSVALEAFLHHP